MAIGRGGGVVLALAGNVLAARALGPARFGKYVLLLSGAGAIAVVGQMGLTTTATRSIAARLALADQRGAWDAGRRALRMALVAGLVATAIAASPLGLVVVHDTFWRQASFATLALWGVIAGLKILELVIPEVFRGFHDLLRASIVGLPSASLLLVIALLASRLGHAMLSLNDLLLLTCAATALGVMPGLIRILGRRSPGGPKVATTVTLGLVTGSVWLSSVLTYVLGQFDLWVAGVFASPGEAARYAVATRLVTLVAAPVLVVALAVTPIIVDLTTRGLQSQLQRVLQLTATISGIPAILMLLLFIVESSRITGLLYGPFYGDAGVLLAILSFGQVVNVLCGPCGMTLLMAGFYRDFLALNAAALGLMLLLTTSLHASMGIRGVALGAAVTLAVQNVATWAVARRRTGISTRVSLTSALAAVRDGELWSHRRSIEGSML